eukprot:sb/3475032/
MEASGFHAITPSSTETPRDGAKSAAAALEDMVKRSASVTPGIKDPRKTKSAKSSKSGKKKKGKKSGKKKKKAKTPPVSFEQLKSPSSMANAYYICHNAPDFLFVRGFKFKALSAWDSVPPTIKMKILGYY